MLPLGHVAPVPTWLRGGRSSQGDRGPWEAAADKAGGDDVATLPGGSAAHSGFVDAPGTGRRAAPGADVGGVGPRGRPHNFFAFRGRRRRRQNQKSNPRATAYFVCVLGLAIAFHRACLSCLDGPPVAALSGGLS